MAAKTENGFTLVELQVALLLVSLITVVMTGALRLALQTWDKVTDKQDRIEHRLLITQTLRRHLSNMRFVRVSTSETESMISFLGNRRQIHFVAPFPTFHNDNTLYWWTLSSPWDDEAQEYQLILTYRPFLADQYLEIQADGSLVLQLREEVEDNRNPEPQPLEPETLVIAADLILKEAEFFYRDAEGLEEWLDEWGPQNYSPLVIRLTIAEIDDGGEEILLPEIAVTPRFANQQLYELEDQL